MAGVGVPSEIWLKCHCLWIQRRLDWSNSLILLPTRHGVDTSIAMVGFLILSFRNLMQMVVFCMASSISEDIRSVTVQHVILADGAFRTPQF